jgi:hypothetical protein
MVLQHPWPFLWQIFILLCFLSFASISSLPALISHLLSSSNLTMGLQQYFQNFSITHVWYIHSFGEDMSGFLSFWSSIRSWSLQQFCSLKLNLMNTYQIKHNSQRVHTTSLHKVLPIDGTWYNFEMDSKWLGRLYHSFNRQRNLSNYSSYHIVVCPKINHHHLELGILSLTVLLEWWPYFNSSNSISI